MPAPRTFPEPRATSRCASGLEVVAEFAYPKSTVAGLPLPGIDAVTLFALDRPVAAAVAARPAAPATPVAPVTPAVTATTAATAPPAPLAPTPGAPGAAGVLVMPDPREFAVAAKPFLALSGLELASAISGDRITLRFRLPEPLATDMPARIFSVRTHATGGETSDWSNLAGLVPRLPPSPPADFLAVASRNGVELSWTAAPAGSPGLAGTGAIAGYNVYRRDAARAPPTARRSPRSTPPSPPRWTPASPTAGATSTP